MYFVYELVDPRTDITGYVGITDNPNRRYSEHIEGREGRGKKYDWIQHLQKEQVQPKMKILEIVDDLEQARTQERYWIQYYISKDMQLTNTITYGEKEKVALAKASPTDDYYIKTQVKEILGIGNCTFNILLRRGVITSTIPDRQGRANRYLKSDIDKLATDLKVLREKRGPSKFTL